MRAKIALPFALIGALQYSTAQAAYNPWPTGTAGSPNASVLSVQGVPGGTALPVSGTFSATLGGFTPSASGARMTQLSVTTSDSSQTLPNGAVTVVSNTGTTNPMYCNVNAVVATTSDQLIPASSWFAFTIPSGVTVLHCISTGGTTTADGLGGAGVPTGSGGGGGGGSGSNASVGTTGSSVPASGTYVGMNVSGNLTGITGTANGLKVDGSAVTQPVSGTVTAAQPTAGNLNATVVGTGTFATQSAINQTTPGTTNGISVANIGANAASTGAGATGTGTLRVGVAQDTTTIAGSAPGTAGTPSANVVTVQGASSMTALLANPGTIATWGLAPVAAGSAPTNMQVSGLIYNSAGVTPTSGQSVALQGDANGYLEVNVKAGASGNAAASATGSAVPSSADYNGVNIAGTLRGQTGINPTGSVYAAQNDLTSVNGTTVVTAASGVQKVGVTGNTGAALDFSGQNASSPANSVLIGGQFNTTPTTVTSGNSSPLQIDNAGNLLVNIKAGASSGTVAQGSTTSGQSGNLIQGAVTTSSPTYTTAQTNPLSLTTAGALRVDASSTTQPVSGTVTANIGTVGTLATAANQTNVQGTAGSPSATVVTVQGVSGGTPQPVSGTVTVTQTTGTNLNATIDTTGSGNLDNEIKGPIAAQSATVPIGGFGLCDGANGATNPCTTAVTVKAASTAPALTDKALVVALASNGDPCIGQTKTNVNITTSAAETSLVGISGTTKIYICSMAFISSTADSISFVEGTGTACATSATADFGSTTAANGAALPANGGMTLGSGTGTVMRTSVAGNAFCLLQSGTTLIAGNLTYVQQ